MAKAFESFVKELAKGCGRAAYLIAGSYNQAIIRTDENGVNVTKTKHRAGDSYRAPVRVLRNKMMRSFSVDTVYQSLSELVIDRTRRGSTVSDAIYQDSLRTNDCLRDIDEASTGWGESRDTSPWEICALSFCFDNGFRNQFERSLENDGLDGDPELLWQGIDRIAGSLGSYSVNESTDDSDLEKLQIDDLNACMGDIVISMLLASLYGANDYAQFLGHSITSTPSLAGAGNEIQEIASTGVVLRRVTPVGQRPWDYVTDNTSGTLVAENQVARIGTDATWCVGGGCVSVISPSKYVSKRHCEVFMHNGEWVIRDLGSRNKTLVVRPDGSKFILSHSETKLRLGDIICVAPVSSDDNLEEATYGWELESTGECYRFEAHL